MILDCPACGARYRLPDDAIPPEGKTVRCARCKHSWVELGQPLDDGPAAELRPGYAVALDALFTTPANTGPARAAAAASEADSAVDAANPTGSAAPAVSAEAGSPTDALSPAPSRRRWLWLVSLLLLIVLALGAAAVLTRAGVLPAPLASRLGLPVLTLPALSRPAVHLPPLDLTRIPYAGPWLDRRLNPPALPPIPLTLQSTAEFNKLGNGSRMLALAGNVMNPTGAQQPVPDIEALLLDASRRTVYRWRIPAPLVALPPRSSAPFDSSASGYPADGTTVTLRFVQER